MNPSPIDYLKNLKLSDACLTVLDGSFGVTAQENAQLIQNGFWHVRFFARSRVWADDNSLALGVRILPNVGVSDSPVVAVSRYGATTIAPQLKNLIPNWLLYLQIESGNWEFLREEWSRVKLELQEVHLALGGEPDLFDRFEAFLTDVNNFKSKGYLAQDSRAYEFLKVDQSIETLNFRKFAQNLIDDPTILPDFSDNFGAWSEYAKYLMAARAWKLHTQGLRTFADSVEGMWLGFNKPAPFDSKASVAKPASQFALTRVPEGALHTLAQTITQFDSNESRLPQSIQNDPLLLTARALASSDFASGYQGVEHMEAAAKLDIDFNDGKRSYEALISASFWSAMNLGFPFKESYQAGLHLAAKYGWDEMLELLEGNEFELTETRA